MTSASPPGNDGVTFGRVVPQVPESAAPDAPPPGTDDAAGHRDELDELVRRAGSLSSLQVRQYVRRMRLLQAVSAVALATVTRDLIEPGTVELLAGPWLSVMRD